MITYRLPWLTLLGGPVLIVMACALSPLRSVEMALVLAGTLLMLDGGLGVQVLPRPFRTNLSQIVSGARVPL